MTLAYSPHWMAYNYYTTDFIWLYVSFQICLTPQCCHGYRRPMYQMLLYWKVCAVLSPLLTVMCPSCSIVFFVYLCWGFGFVCGGGGGGCIVFWFWGKYNFCNNILNTFLLLFGIRNRFIWKPSDGEWSHIGHTSGWLTPLIHQGAHL